jgi:uncharacterized membrane protein YqhA
MSTDPDRADAGLQEAGERVLAASLRLSIVPVVTLVAAALGSFVYGTAFFVHSARAIASHPFPVGHQIGLFLLDIDLFLIGATLLISAVGFYELFIAQIERKEGGLPDWLVMRDLNDLKARVLAMVVMVLAVTFAEVVVDSPSGRHVLQLGVGLGAVIVALTAFLRLSGHAVEPRD